MELTSLLKVLLVLLLLLLLRFSPHHDGLLANDTSLSDRILLLLLVGVNIRLGLDLAILGLVSVHGLVLHLLLALLESLLDLIVLGLVPQLLDERSDAGDLVRSTVARVLAHWREVVERRARREQPQEIGRELGCHYCP